jgi:hypothetical protein
MTASLTFADVRPQRDELWERCRNSLGIARLLVLEGRPLELVSTACQLAVETACRSALEQRGERFDGDLVYAMARLDAPLDLWEAGRVRSRAQWLQDAERTVAWLAEHLRREAPERSWRF